MQQKLKEISDQSAIDSGVFVLLGLPGSGKSTVTSEVLRGKNSFIRAFDLYLVISPSKMPEIEIDDTYYSQTLSIAWLGDRLTKIVDLTSGMKSRVRLLIVMDDCVS